MTRPTNKHLTSLDIVKLIEEVKKGELTHKEIAKNFGIIERVLRNHLRYYNKESQKQSDNVNNILINQSDYLVDILN